MFQEVQLISQQLEKVMEIIGEIRRMAREAAERERRTSPGTAARATVSSLDGRPLPVKTQ